MSQVIRFGPEDKGDLASFLRTSIAAVRTLLGIPTDAVAYHVTVNYLAGTFYPSHLDEAGRDAPGDSVSNLCLQGDAIVLFTPCLGVSEQEWPPAGDGQPEGPLVGLLPEGCLYAFRENIRLNGVHGIYRTTAHYDCFMGEKTLATCRMSLTFRFGVIPAKDLATSHQIWERHNALTRREHHGAPAAKTSKRESTMPARTEVVSSTPRRLRKTRSQTSKPTRTSPGLPPPPKRNLLHKESKFNKRPRKWTVTWLKKDRLEAADEVVFERGTQYNLCNPSAWSGPGQLAGCREYTLLALLRVQVDIRKTAKVNGEKRNYQVCTV